MIESKSTFRIPSSLLLGILSAMCFVTSQTGYIGMSDLPASSTSLLWTALAGLFAMLFALRAKYAPLKPLHLFAGLFFGVCNAFGGLLFAYDQWDYLLEMQTLFLTLLRSVGQGFPMVCFLSLIDTFLRRGLLTKPLKRSIPSRLSPWIAFYEKKPLFTSMLVLLLGWLPYLLIFYPGTVCWDLGEMAAQFYGLREMNTWHPVFLTWIFGALMEVGRFFGSDNLGAFLFTLLQTAFLSYALSRVMVFLNKQKVNLAYQGFALAFFALTPFFGGYAQFISKDTLYVATLLLFCLTVIDILLYTQSKVTALPLSVLVRLLIWAVLPSLIRSNGLYVVLPTAICLVLFGVCKRARLQAGLSLGIALSLIFCFHQIFVPSLGIVDATSSGLYSVCFQQSARVLRDHPESVTQEEYDEINRVLDAEHLPQLYEPWISDPVKYTFKQYGLGADVEKEALKRYQQTWLSMLGKYPLDYAEAFFAGNISYYTFMPKIEGETYNNQAGNRLVFETYAVGNDPLDVHTSHIAFLEPLGTLLAIFARGWRHIPLLSLLYTCAWYTWIVVGCAVSLFHQKRFWLLVAFVPALFSLAVCMLSPVNDYFRYFLPIVSMTIPLLCISSHKSI